MASSPSEPACASPPAVASSGAPATFFCYLLLSIKDVRRGHTYIGFTVNPVRRLKEHNGELQGGARHTLRRRPWTMIACVWGFPSAVAALHFEWAWQYPRASRLVRALVEDNARKSGSDRLSFSMRPIGQLNLLYSMLALQPWCHFGLHVRFLREDDYKQLHLLGVDRRVRAALPAHMDVTWGRLEDLEWFGTLSKAGREAARARGEGDTRGEEPSGLNVEPQPNKRRKPRAAGAQEDVASAKGKKKRGAAAAGDGLDAEEADEEDAPAACDDAEDDELALHERDHAPDDDSVDSNDEDDEARMWQPVPFAAASSAAAAAATSAHEATSQQIDSDYAFAQALARELADGDSALMREGVLEEDDGGAGFRFDSDTNSFVLLDDDDQECDVDMTLQAEGLGSIDAAAAGSAANVAAASSSDAAAAAVASSSSPTSAVLAATASRDNRCKLCQHSPPTPPSSVQLSNFGFETLRSVCPHCKEVAHLLCFQKHMQEYRPRTPPTAAAATSSSMAASTAAPSAVSPPPYPLLPAPAPCPFCHVPLVWCCLVENTHRYHAPGASSASAAGATAGASSKRAAAPPPSRTIGQYFKDAAVAFKQIVRLQVMQQMRKQQAAKLQAAKEAKETKEVKKAKGKGKAAAAKAVAVEMEAAAAILPAQSRHDFFSQQQDALYAPSTPDRPPAAASRKRRSRSLTPTRPSLSPGQSLTASSPTATTASAVSPLKGCGAVDTEPTRPSTLPVRSLSVPFTHAANGVRSPSPLNKRSRAMAKPRGAAAAAAAPFPRKRSPPASSIGKIDEDDEDEFDSATAAPLRASQSSAAAFSIGSGDVDLTRAPSLWERCEAAAAAAATAGPSLTLRPLRTASAPASSDVLPAVAPARAVSPIAVLSSDSEPEEREEGGGHEQPRRHPLPSQHTCTEPMVLSL